MLESRNMRPILLSLGPYSVLAGPVFAGLSALLAFFYYRANRNHAKLTNDELWTLMAYLTVGTFLGAVFLYVTLYGGGPIRNINYMARFRAIQGGTYYGNYWGCFAASMIFAYRQKKSLPLLADLLGCAAVLGLFLFRWGCLQHGCCHGTITDLPWGITFKIPFYGIRSTLLGLPVHPVQIYSSAASLVIFLYAHFSLIKKRNSAVRPGDAFVATTVLYGIFRFLVEFVRGSDYGMLQPLGLTTSQLLAAASIAAALALRKHWHKESSA